MKRFVLLLFLFNSSVTAQSVYQASKGEVTFYSYTPVEDIKATSAQLNSFLNTSTGELAFIIPMRSFHFEKSKMEEHFNEKFVESEKYPQATFNGKLNEKIDLTKTGKMKVTAKGKLTIHGKEKEIQENGELEIGKDQLNLAVKFYIAIAEYNIEKPKILFQNIADTVEVNINAIYIPYKKK